jgi:actin-related protein
MLMNVASQRHLNIHSAANRKYLAWLGASLMSSLDTFASQTMFSGDYFSSGIDALLAQKN